MWSSVMFDLIQRFYFREKKMQFEKEMYGGIGIPVRVGENETMTVKNALEVTVPFWDELVQEKIKEFWLQNKFRFFFKFFLQFTCD